MLDEKEQQLYNLAEALVHEYSRQLSARTKRSYYGAKKWNEAIWLRVARLVDELHATPENFITAQFRLSRGSVFAASLSGKVAKDRYLKWLEQNRPNTGMSQEDKTDEPLDVQLLRERLTTTYDSLLYDCKSLDLADSAVIAKIIATQYHWDPVVMMMLNPTPLFKKLFGARAKAQIDESRGLRDAIIELGFDVILDYLNEEEGQS